MHKIKFSNRKKNRLACYDYSQGGHYFITACTKSHFPWFGKIVDGKMRLYEIGKIAHKCFSEIPEHFVKVSLDEFVVMPNHIHGIIIIYTGDLHQQTRNVIVGNAHGSSLPTDRMKMMLSNVINGFKSSVTRLIRKQLCNYEFAWQKSFYDHIIRSEKSLKQIRQYIQDTHLKWQFDKYNPENL